MVQIGSTPNSYAALQANKLACVIMSPPFSWQAQDLGFPVLGTQTSEIAKAWPKHVIGSGLNFMNENRRTCQALLRGHVNAILMIRGNRDAAVPIMMDQIKITKAFAERAIDVEAPFYDERGNLPAKSTMDVYWQIAQQLDIVKAPWPQSKFLDRRFIDSFKAWAP